jgi:vanillate O-demethylase ferredoxin subunit
MFPVTVADVADEAIDVRSFEFASATPLPAYTPGSHVEVHLQNGLARCYSLCGLSPDRYRIAVKRIEGSAGVSCFLHDEVKLGDILHIGHPRNFFPLQAASHTLLFAGGIGITPLIPMAHQLIGDGSSFKFCYFARSPQHAAFRNLLDQPPLASHTELHFGLSAQDTRFQARSLIEQAPSGTRIYVCGPEGLIETVQECVGEFRPDLNVHFERFHAAPGVTSGQAFEVVLQRSGRSLTIPQDKSILEVLEESGLTPRATCRQGVCGSCIVDVLDGVPDHRDEVLTEQERSENTAICICVSRALSGKLTLDM